MSHEKPENEVDVMISVSNDGRLVADRLDHSIIGRLLEMAHRYRREGELRQATEIYWSLLNDHNGTTQANMAKIALMDLAADYEMNNARHMARSIYEQLLKYEE